VDDRLAQTFAHIVQQRSLQQGRLVMSGPSQSPGDGDGMTLIIRQHLGEEALLGSLRQYRRNQALISRRKAAAPTPGPDRQTGLQCGKKL
jgi:uncharacterized protein YciI